MLATSVYRTSYAESGRATFLRAVTGAQWSHPSSLVRSDRNKSMYECIEL
jgi:hypothetical protein